MLQIDTQRSSHVALKLFWGAVLLAALMPSSVFGKPSRETAGVLLANLPLSFEENRGQLPDSAKAFARGAGYQILAKSDAVELIIPTKKGRRRVTLRLELRLPDSTEAASFAMSPACHNLIRLELGTLVFNPAVIEEQPAEKDATPPREEGITACRLRICCARTRGHEARSVSTNPRDLWRSR